jgi:8-oxo-dGTP pyrophosphatase MutT (NUDIX family)
MGVAGTFKIPQSVLVVIYNPALEVLLIKRADVDDFWQSVTGSKDELQETFEQTARREVFEETGIDCRPGSPLAGHLQDWRLENIYEIYPLSTCLVCKCHKAHPSGSVRVSTQPANGCPTGRPHNSAFHHRTPRRV